MKRLSLIVYSLLMVLPVSADLVNRYSFTGSGAQAADSVAGQHATLYGNATQSGGTLLLDGHSSSWAQMPGNVLGDSTSASVETWFTLNASSGWQRIFDFGDTSGTHGGYYWFYSPSGDNTSRLVISTSGFPGYQTGDEIVSASALPTGTLIHLVCVYDQAASEMRLYQNGEWVASTSVTMQLSDVRRQFAYIGKSVYPNDPTLNGAINEFRIYNEPLNALTVTLNNQLGPDTYKASVLESMSPANNAFDANPVTFSWSAKDDVAVNTYHVYVSTNPEHLNPVIDVPSIAAIYSGPDTSFVADTLDALTDYYWRVDTVTAESTRYTGPRFMFSTLMEGGVMHIEDDIQTYSALSNTIVNMSGRSELHLTGTSNPLPGSEINLNSPDAWVFFENFRPSVVHSTYLSQIQVNGAPASLNNNVRVVQYLTGTVVIPHGPNYQPLEVFSGINFSGTSMNLGLYTFHRPAQLGMMNNAISSFRLKRGYMATFAEESNGHGHSKVYIAADEDLEIGVMTPMLDNSVSFVRVFPWRWVAQKGWSGTSPGGANQSAMVDSHWRYDWDNGAQSTLDIEYVPMRHNAGWPGWNNFSNKQNVTHALGFNEPDQHDQANMTVDEAIALWPRFMESGLRIGSPAPTDGGRNWLYNFIDRADELGYRVDFVAVHFYWNNQTGASLLNFLRDVHLRTGRPVWVTEWNNGCNWTTPHPTFEQNAARIQDHIIAMASVPFVERYSIYQWCTNRELIVNNQLTPAGVVYRDHISPMAVVLDSNNECIGYWRLDETDGTFAEDLSGRQNHGILKNGLSFNNDSVPGMMGNALRFDGIDDHIELPAGFDVLDNGFSASFWARPTAVKNFARFVDLGNGAGNDNIVIARDGTTNRLGVRVYNGSSAGSWVHANNAITLDTWQFFTITIRNRSSNNVRIYRNGQLIQTGTSAIPRSVFRNSNYIGRSNWESDAYYEGDLDDLRFFDYALHASEVETLYLANDSRPFDENPAAIPGRIQAQDFDLGNQGIAYYDTTDGNSGGQYRLDADVDIRTISDYGSGYAVFDIDAGEWLNYTVDVTETGDYALYLRASAIADNIPVDVVLNDELLATVLVNQTGSLNTFQTFVVNSLSLTAGSYQTLRLEFPVGGLEVNWIEFVKPGPWNGQPHTLAGIIQAQAYDIGGPGVAYDDTTPNNTGGSFRFYENVDVASITDGIAGYAIDNIESGEWLTYTVNSSAAETDVHARIASTQAGGQIRVWLDEMLMATLDVPDTGSLDTWQTVSAPCHPLPDRENATLKLEFVGSGYRLNLIAFKNRRPYLGEPFELPGRIEFKDYDVGGQWVSYFDRSGTNGYGHYRPHEPVDIMPLGGNYVVFAETGEWLEYTCNIEPGYYTLVIRNSVPYNPMQTVLSIDGQRVAQFALPSSGGFNHWQDTVIPNIYLPGGQEQHLQVSLLTTAGVLDYMEFVRDYNPADITQSGRVDIDDFSVLAAQWLGVPGTPSADIAPPPGGDGVVDLLDLLMLAENWLTE